MFKVGDKVKVVDIGKSYTTYKDFIKENAPQLLNKWEYERCLPDGGSYEVKAIGKHKWGNELAIIEQNNKVYIVDFKGLELVKQFTKSDLKDNHIIKARNGHKYVWSNYQNQNRLRADLRDSYWDNDIIEVYEFETLVWKREEQILDEVEKKYLGDVIRPFRDRVDGIKKEKHIYGEKIKIYYDIKLNEINYMSLPYFEKGTMYKNMEIDKEYTLKELGLE